MDNANRAMGAGVVSAIREDWRGLGVAVGFLVVILGIGLANILVTRSVRKFRTALSVEDISAARREYADLVDFWRRRGRETINAYQIYILLLEERYQEALNELRELDHKKLGEKGRSGGSESAGMVEPHSWIRPATRYSCWLSMLCDVGRGEADGSRDSSRASDNTTLQSLVADAGAFL